MRGRDRGGDGDRDRRGRPRLRAGTACAARVRARARPSTRPASTASSIPRSSTGTASAGSDRSPETGDAAQPLRLAHAPTLAIVRGAIDSASAAASAGSWKRRGASRTSPNGSVTALNVPNTTRIVAEPEPFEERERDVAAASHGAEEHERGAEHDAPRARRSGTPGRLRAVGPGTRYVA